MSDSRLVYSTSNSNTCPKCSKPLNKCRCEHEYAKAEAHDGIVRLQLERKGRGGKQVTVITGLLEPNTNSKALVKRLKALCSTGGTTKGVVVEIQGDNRTKIKSFLEKEGYTVKISGG